ncbi:Acetylspermidine deacetylase [Dissulfuribacter thermophilus]|uniref:Acetylspermidine deacetylase n=1 Tax=Dissulfuribacter thermophilus TaxID=1156395 RepID=A0A1B9F835_9BACT|nr:histone deacetylase [Dissulfuribacter thermophilus]OCC16076.1 Acetylspermidine deacetylase [Dissulfuribacter thermophilus]
MKKIGIVRDNRYMDHIPGPSHVESPERLKAIYQAIDECFVHDELINIEPRQANFEELNWNHYANYIKSIEATQNRQDFTTLDPDTIACPESFSVATLAVGGVFAAIDAIMTGKVEAGFCLIRPPGHHAEPDRAMGFCLFNNIALGAYYCQKVHSLDRCMIVDFDLHHGNGTQRSFYSQKNVLYFSTHQYPYYPGTGAHTEVGSGSAKGFTVNCPLPAGCGDQDYAAIFKLLLDPICSSFKPDIILVSAGFDIFWQDPLGGMNVTEKGFSAISRALITMAETTCNGRLLFVLEGGYSMDGLKTGVISILRQLVSRKEDDSVIKDATKFLEEAQPFAARQSLEKAIGVQKSYWDL